MINSFFGASLLYNLAVIVEMNPISSFGKTGE